mgnify:CR=1 FL=1|jgi:NAD(P)H dehydrogenase (quinone)
MRALVIYCHPAADSFTAAVRDTVLARLRAAGAETRLTDLYADGFQPLLTPDEWQGYLNFPANRQPVDSHCADVQWCDTMIFIYPTWWYGLPAMLKGWLDRVLLPDVAFLMPDDRCRTIRPGLRHITGLGIFTTCGASRWLTFAVGSPGRRLLTRGVGWLCNPRKRTVFAAHYLMDSSSAASRARHLARVGAKMDRLIGPAPAARRAALPEAAE